MLPTPVCPRTPALQVCAKVFASKRKVFNVAAARVAGTDAAKFFDPKKGQPKITAPVRPFCSHTFGILLD